MELESKVIDMLIPHNRRQLINHDDAKARLQSKVALICPDTCVLIRIIKLQKYHTQIKNSSDYLEQLNHCLFNIDKWLSQVEACKELFSMNEVGWVIPQQVLREASNCRNEFSDLKNYKENLRNAERSSHPEVQKTICSMIEKLDELIEEVTKICTCIVNSFIILEEKPKHAADAWKRVHDDEFPNLPKNQQMKDSVILYHLLDFSISVRKPLFLWTFDMFDGSENRGLFSFPGNLSENIVVARDIRDALYDIKNVVKGSR